MTLGCGVGRGFLSLDRVYWPCHPASEASMAHVPPLKHHCHLETIPTAFPVAGEQVQGIRRPLSKP